MDALNKDPKNNIDIRFGTFKYYYDEVFKRMGPPKVWKHLPTVTGDFSPYADRTVDYWTGYFTSHPYQKALSRSLERHIRTAEIMYSLALLRKVPLDGDQLLQCFENATMALGLFQHVS